MDAWPNLPGRSGFTSRPNFELRDQKVGSDLMEGSIDEANSSEDFGGGGVPLGHSTSIDFKNNETPTGAKTASLSQSDRLKRYVESGSRVVGNSDYKVINTSGRTSNLNRVSLLDDTRSEFGGSSISVAGGSRIRDHSSIDDDARSVSTAFASQVGISGYD